MKAKLKNLGIGVGVAAFWLIVWHLLSLAVEAELLLPSPATVFQTWFELIGTADFWAATVRSLWRVLGGFVAAVAVGSALAVLTANFRIARRLLAPPLHIVKAAPVASFIILALVWIRSDALPAFIAFLMVVPPVWDAVEQGIRQTDPQLLEMARIYRLTPWQSLTHVRLPSVAPYLLSAMNTGMGFAWKSAIAAEIICKPTHSIGDYLQQAKLYLETPAVFAWTATAVLLSMGLTALMRRLTRPLQARFGREVL